MYVFITWNIFCVSGADGSKIYAANGAPMLFDNFGTVDVVELPSLHRVAYYMMFYTILLRITNKSNRSGRM
jgi:hypothetical protein